MTALMEPVPFQQATPSTQMYPTDMPTFNNWQEQDAAVVSSGQRLSYYPYDAPPMLQDEAMLQERVYRLDVRDQHLWYAEQALDQKVKQQDRLYESRKKKLRERERAADTREKSINKEESWGKKIHADQKAAVKKLRNTIDALQLVIQNQPSKQGEENESTGERPEIMDAGNQTILDGIEDSFAYYIPQQEFDPLSFWMESDVRDASQSMS